ncbi:MAG: tetratricopeptide repeat protein [Thermodesulfovibrionales bacterium]
MRRLALLLILVSLVAAGCEKDGSEPIGRGSEPTPLVTAENEIQMLNDVLKREPGNVDALIRLGNVSMDTNRFQEAVDAYQRALELQPENVDVRVDMGTCYKNLGMPDKAVETYRKAISINPRHPYAHRNLGVVLGYDLGRKKEAADAFEAYLKLMPTAPDADLIREEIEKFRAS